MEIVWIVAIVVIIAWLICGAAGAAILSRYEKEQTGFLLGFLLGPIGLVIAWTMRDSQKHKEILQAAGVSPSSAQQQGHRKERNCPFCAELILIEAKICKHCRSEVEPEVEPEQVPIDFFEDLGAKFAINENRSVTYLDLSGRFSRQHVRVCNHDYGESDEQECPSGGSISPIMEASS